MSAAQFSQQDYTKFMLSVCFDAVEQWNKSYDKTKQTAPEHGTEFRPSRLVSETRAAPPKNIAARVYNQVIANQMACCRFAEHRLSQLLGIPEAAARCTSPLDILALQASFVKKTFDDYAMEGARLMEMFLPWSPRGILNAKA